MSKSFIKSGLVALAAIVLASCAKTEEFKYDPDSALQIESVSGISPFSIMQNQVSKAVITGESLPGDEAAKGIGIFVTASDGSAYDGHDTGYTNVKYANGGSGWSTATPVYLSDVQGKLYGYFPYNQNANDLRAIPVASSLNGTDYLYADTKDVSHKDKTVALQMNHALTRLHLTIKKGAKFTADASLSKITLKSTAIDASGTMDLTTGAITPAKLPAETGKVDLTTEGEITVEGIEKDILLVPADNSAGKKDIIIVLTIDNKQTGITLSGENGLDIRSGIQNNVTLTIEDTGIKVTGVDVGVWGEGGSQTMEVKGHTVTVKLSDDAADAGIADDVLTNVKVDGNNVIIKASSYAGKYLKCILSSGELCHQSKAANQVYTFTVSDVTSDLTATIGYAKSVNITKIVTPQGIGAINVTGECLEGEDVTISAVSSDARYTFGEWHDKDGKKLDWTNPQTITLSQDITVTAVFDILKIIPGEFSTASDKSVYFSIGNLRYKDNAWSFYENQYEYNNGGYINYFTWGYGEWSTNSKSTNYLTGYKGKNFPYSNDWGSAVTSSSIWRTLTSDEWNYLLFSREVNGGTGENHSYQAVSASVGGIGVNGLFLFPDNFTGQADLGKYKTWSEIFAAGIVFLPAAGAKDSYEGECRYWTSTSDKTYDTHAYFVKLGNTSVKKLELTACQRNNKQSVRLVTDVK